MRLVVLFSILNTFKCITFQRGTSSIFLNCTLFESSFSKGSKNFIDWVRIKENHVGGEFNLMNLISRVGVYKNNISSGK